uniref:Uncharacterized protein n=1 Tax=Chaetoceros debilis TaxID=122233 RepID=A0A7S3PU81_9STRA|mmetsp:Transcript_10323/g.15605  ORF Transcript_10323/g.15605 Transcript_10323/m.15605 type:complete len:384 (+) Transcript_10323:150-1301(+)
MSSNIAAQVKSLTESVVKEILNNESPSVEQCLEILTSVQSTIAPDHETKSVILIVSIRILEESKLGKMITKSLKHLRRHKRSSESDGDSTAVATWNQCIAIADKILISLREQVAAESGQRKAKKVAVAKAESFQPGLPKTSGAYKERLRVQKKEMYKDPPAMPPAQIKIEEEWVGEPSRDEETGEMKFIPGSDSSAKLKEFLKDFCPNRSPKEILNFGAFGGTYYRPIVSAVTNIKYKSSDVLKNSVQKEWIEGLDHKTMLTSLTYQASVNKFKVKCGGSLGMWESSGWISDSDPYGWFQWYCRFYQGRRCGDDERQVSRWLKSAGPKGRFRSQLCNKIFAAGGFSHVNSVRISPVIRQTLLHWGLEITETVLRKHGIRVGKL